ncbi:hypothetical protein [Paenibacillus tengchongensis]|uniref:hypothetical protein n=1 Tax=Paenibacillus tengchongensis TaxID=2608684 RepID=UPI00124F5B10|nr:hypothetical protein [Paenibacillus tengchongensis]
MFSKRDALSLLALIAALILVNVFGNTLESHLWPRFTLLANCILVQGMFLTLLGLFRNSASRTPSIALILLSLLTGFISFVIIFNSRIDSLNQVLVLVLQVIITYTEASLLRRERNRDRDKQI